jgi:hypothetical protein
MQLYRNYVLDNLKLHKLFVRQRCFEALFTGYVYNGCVIALCFYKLVASKFPSETLEPFVSFHLMDVLTFAAP